MLGVDTRKLLSIVANPDSQGTSSRLDLTKLSTTEASDEDDERESENTCPVPPGAVDTLGSLAGLSHRSCRRCTAGTLCITPSIFLPHTALIQTEGQCSREKCGRIPFTAQFHEFLFLRRFSSCDIDPFE